MTPHDQPLSAQNKESNRIPDPELASLLDQSHPCVLSIPRDGRGPIATPLWYEFRDGKFVLAMDGGSVKAKLLARAGRATITIQRPIEPYQYVMVEGETHILTDQELEARGETVWSCNRRVVARYLEADLVDRYIAMLPILAPNYKILELTPLSVRGESMRYHKDSLPKKEEISALLEAVEQGLKEGKSIEEVRDHFFAKDL